MRELREGLGLSIRMAAQRSGVSHGTIQNIEARGLDGRSFDIVNRIARGYGVSVSNLHRVSLGLEPVPEETLRSLERYQVHPGWVVLPVYGMANAGDDGAEPIEHEPALVPRRHLSRCGANIDTTRAYIVDGYCMVSAEALRTERSFAPGDYLAVDVAKEYEPGDVVAAWWDDRQKLVIKRFGFERVDVVLTPVSPGHVSMALPNADEVAVIGPVVWRGG